MAINDPRDIPGLLIWCSAEAITGLADGATVTQWADLSGNGNHLTAVNSPAYQSTGGANGGPRVVFDEGTADRFTLPTNVLTGAAAGEMALTLRPTTGSSGDLGFASFGTSTDTTHFPYQGTIYDSFGSTTRKTVGPVTLNAWHRYQTMSKAGGWTAWLDGTQLFTTTTNVVGWQATPILGYSGAASWYFNGSIGLVLLYGRELTTTERADLDTWIAANPSGGTVAASPTNQIALAGAAQVPNAAFALDAQAPPIADVEISLAGAASAASASFALEALEGGATVDLTLAGSAAPAVATFDLLHSGGYVATSDRYANDGYNYDGTAAVYNEPPIDEAPTYAPGRKKVMHVHQSMSAPTLVDGRPV